MADNQEGAGSQAPAESLHLRLQSIPRDLEPPYHGTLVNDQVLVFDHGEGSSLYARGFFGKPVGIKKPDPNMAFARTLQLNLFEAVYLIKRGWLVVTASGTGKEWAASELEGLARQHHDKFDEKYLIYEDLREKGYVVRPGLKFGAHFVVYSKGPGIDHSSFVVQVLEHQNQISAIDMVRAGRLATSVKKRFVIACISSGDSPFPLIVYYIFKWHKP